MNDFLCFGAVGVSENYASNFVSGLGYALTRTLSRWCLCCFGREYRHSFYGTAFRPLRKYQTATAHKPMTAISQAMEVG